MATIELKHTSLFDDANLVAYYQLEGNSNDSKDAFNGTDTVITYGTDYGKFNQGALFNGSTSKIALPNLGISGATARTVSMWIKPTAIANIPCIAGWGEDFAFLSFRIHLNVISSKDIYVVFGTSDFYTPTNAVGTGVWYHVVVTYDGGTLSTSTVHIYVNSSPLGLTKAGAGTGAANTTDANFSIGYDQFYPLDITRFFSGAVDDVAIFNRALTATEVSDLYNGNLPPASSVSASPSISPSVSLSLSPSVSPSVSISLSPSVSISLSPSVSPSVSKSLSPSVSPSVSKSLSPSVSPSVSVSLSPSVSPSPSPSAGYQGYSRGDYANLPANDDDLETLYSAGDVVKVATKDDIRVDQTHTDGYAIHQFKDFVGAGNSCNLEWEGQSTYAPTSDTVYLQIYNHTTSTWITVDSDNTSLADTDFILTADIPDLTNYKDASNVISCRVYQIGV